MMGFAALALFGAVVGCAAEEELTGNTEGSEKAQAYFAEIRPGMTIEEVKSLLGEPDDTQHDEFTYAGSTTVTDYLYYGQPGNSDGWYQFAFEDGKLTSKSRN